jgi:hypothetical protein
MFLLGCSQGSGRFVFLETPHGGGQVCQDQATRGRLTGVASAMSSVREASSEGVASGTVSQRYLPQLQVSLAGGRQGSWSGAPPPSFPCAGVLVAFLSVQAPCCCRLVAPKCRE